MDVKRPSSVARNKKIRHAVYIVLAMAAIGGVSYGVSKLKPAAPTVERATVLFGTVKRGPMVRNVRGLGTLVPEDIVWIPATTSGRVDKRLVQPGTVVNPSTILFELSNPELQQQLLEAQQQLNAAEAEYNNRKVDLETQLLNQKAAAASVRSELSQAKLQADANEQLGKEGIVSDLVLKQSQTRANELATRYELEQKRIEMNTEAVKTQLAVSQATLEQRRAMVNLRLKQVSDLKVRAGMSGVLQMWAVEVGQQVTPGTNLARVSDPSRLKAQVRVAETQTKDLQIGQQAEIDTRNGIVPGRVTRIDPQAQNGQVTVDVSLAGALPKGARPDMNVDGTIIFENLDDVVFIERPAFGQPNGQIMLFKVEPDDQHATAVQVKLGRDAVTTIEIREGLKVGDKVILSDMSQWQDKSNRVRLN
jgi:HlyD family secretion protein